MVPLDMTSPAVICAHAGQTICTFFENTSLDWYQVKLWKANCELNRTVQWSWKHTALFSHGTSATRHLKTEVKRRLNCPESNFRNMISPFTTISCAKRNLSSTRFVMLLVPNRVATLCPAALSVWRLILLAVAAWRAVPCAMAYSLLRQVLRILPDGSRITV